MRTHQELDARSLAMHRLIAAKIRQDPALFDRARATLARWRIIVCVNSQPYLAELERLFEQGIEAALAVATEDTERATALRQSSPFCGILTEDERLGFLKSWSSAHRRG